MRCLTSRRTWDPIPRHSASLPSMTSPPELLALLWILFLPKCSWSLVISSSWLECGRGRLFLLSTISRTFWKWCYLIWDLEQSWVTYSKSSMRMLGSSRAEEVGDIFWGLYSARKPSAACSEAHTVLLYVSWIDLMSAWPLSYCIYIWIAST